MQCSITEHNELRYCGTRCPDETAYKYPKSNFGLFVAGAGAATEFAVAAGSGDFYAAAGESAGFAEVGGHPAAGAEHALEQGGEIKVGVDGGEVKAVAFG
jgi:hypothetical protein